MKVQLILSLLVALALSSPFEGLERRQGKGKGKGKGRGKTSGGGGTEGVDSLDGKAGNNAMKNGWEPVTKSKGAAEPCLKPADCDYSHLTMNDLINGPCRPVTFIFARATTEQGNMGAAAGTGVARYLAGHYGLTNVAVQGVKYPADIGGNLSAGGCSAKGISEAVRLFNLANTKCPKTVIAAGGYSQGTACIHRSIPKLSAQVQKKIAGVVLFGDTQATQTGRKIQGLDASRVKIYCNSGDAVCSGTLVITQAHFQYTPSVAPATQFLIQNIDAMRSKSGAAPITGAPADTTPAEVFPSNTVPNETGSGDAAPADTGDTSPPGDDE